MFLAEAAVFCNQSPVGVRSPLRIVDTCKIYLWSNVKEEKKKFLASFSEKNMGGQEHTAGACEAGKKKRGWGQ